MHKYEDVPFATVQAQVREASREIRTPFDEFEANLLAMRGLIAQLPSGRASAKKSKLTPRQTLVLSYYAEGKSDWEIGVILKLSASTVHGHVEDAKRRLGVRTRAQAVHELDRMAASGL